MLTIRKANERGVANFGWLNSHHTFSFGGYYDPAHMGFGPLRVINDDRVAGGGGFSTHSHRDMEIISYVIDGALEHKDNIGNGSVIKPGDVQRMSAGTGISHSEYNHSTTDPVHFLQIWVVPEKRGIEPGYEQKYFDPTEQHGTLRLVGSRDGRNGSVTVHQDVNLYSGHLATGDNVTYHLEGDRQAWVHVVKGRLDLNGESLSTGDGAAIADIAQVSIQAQTDDAELLLFDLAA
ncbi:MAG: pirin family protein [Merismopedia sp. SIO2A8]|nr:pirin family protein [Symploca sp. SIO2B6]NET48150.1 pirin family protein [Merismopedia sp. SIO2A8]